MDKNPFLELVDQDIVKHFTLAGIPDTNDNRIAFLIGLKEFMIGEGVVSLHWVIGVHELTKEIARLANQNVSNLK